MRELRIADGGVDASHHAEHVGRQRDVDDLGAFPPQGRGGLVDHRVPRGLHAQEVAHQTQASTLQRPGCHGLHVVDGSARHDGLVARVGTRHHSQHRRQVGHRGRHRAHRVEGQGQRNDAATAGQAERRPDPGDAVRRGRSANRTTSVGAQCEGGEPGGDGSAAAPARPGRRPIHGKGVADLPAERRQRCAAGELAHVGQPEDDAAGAPEPSSLLGVLGRHRVAQAVEACRRRPPGDVDVRLEEHRNPMQRASRPARPTLGIQCASVLKRRGTEPENGVQRRAGLVVGGDARQVQRGQPLGREHSGREGAAEVGDRGGREIDGPSGATADRYAALHRGHREQREQGPPIHGDAPVRPGGDASSTSRRRLDRQRDAVC